MTGASTLQVFRWGAKNLSLATSDGSRLWHGDITSPFPTSGNEGYVHNRDVLYLSVTTSYVVMTLGVHGKCHNLNPVTTLWNCKSCQAATWQTIAMQRSQPAYHPNAIRYPWYPQGPEGSITLLVIAKPLFLSPHTFLNWRDFDLHWKTASSLSFLCLVLRALKPIEKQGLTRGWKSGDTSAWWSHDMYRGAMTISGLGSATSAEVVSCIFCQEDSNLLAQDRCVSDCHWSLENAAELGRSPGELNRIAESNCANDPAKGAGRTKPPYPPSPATVQVAPKDKDQVHFSFFDNVGTAGPWVSGGTEKKPEDSSPSPPPGKKLCPRRLLRKSSFPHFWVAHARGTSSFS